MRSGREATLRVPQDAKCPVAYFWSQQSPGQQLAWQQAAAPLQQDPPGQQPGVLEQQAAPAAANALADNRRVATTAIIFAFMIGFLSVVRVQVMRRSAENRYTRPGLDPKIVFQAKDRRMKSHASVQQPHRLTDGLWRNGLHHRRAQNGGLRLEAGFGFLRNLFDAVGVEAPRHAAARCRRAARHVHTVTMHRRYHRRPCGSHGDHPHRHKRQRQQAREAAMRKSLHVPDSTRGGLAGK